ncbi:MAG: response regulator [Deltaproteobacteria bacterium]|nr:response regulator [Deltaproteobacteria bacterium]
MCGCSTSAFIWIFFGVIVLIIRHFVRKHRQEREQEYASWYADQYRQANESSARQMSRQTAEQMRFSLTEAELSRGSPPTAVPAPSAEPVQRPRIHAGPLGDARILVADESKTIRRMVTGLLEGEGAEVARASSGGAAWRTLSSEDFDLLIVDEALPEINSYFIAERVRSDPKLAGLPIILLTPKGGPRDPEACQRAFRYVISKPFDSQQLVGTAALAIEESSQAREIASASTSAQPDESPWEDVPAEGPTCPVCEHVVEELYAAETCPTCGAVHHAECWKLNDGCGRCENRT